MTVAIVALDRERALGERHRLASWERLIRAAGHEPVLISLRAEHPSGPRPGSIPDLGAVLLHGAAPEILGWSAHAAFADLEALRPDAVVAVTMRAYHPGLVEVTPTVVLDFVDKLSESYRERASRLDAARALGFRALAATMARAERRVMAAPVRRVAAGRGDAAALNATWVPILPPAPEVAPARGGPFEHDLLFFGNLSYAPNLAAVEALARCWSSLQRRRPDTSLLVAGRYPTARVRELVATHAWTLAEDFPSVPELCARARIAVAPIPGASGIQIKVLEAAAQAMPQVITPAVAAGLSEDFPVRVAADDAAFVDAVVDLLGDEAAARALGLAAWAHMRERFCDEAWVDVVAELLRPDG